MTRLPHAQAVIICNRAWRIVNRVMPDWSATPHGFHQTALFIERCQHSAARNRLYKAVFARLAAKATVPILDLSAEELRDPFPNAEAA